MKDGLLKIKFGFNEPKEIKGIKVEVKYDSLQRGRKRNGYIQSFNSSPITWDAILIFLRRAFTIFSSTVPSAIIST
jgi:hypothetical protein